MMRPLLIAKILLISLLALSFNSFAQTATQQLAQTLDNLHTMQAQFEQTVQDGRGQVLQNSSGSMALSRPGKFRWDTQHPSAQLLIADGEKVWFYDADLQQVTLSNQHTARNGSPALLLDGTTTSLTQDFNVANISANSAAQTFKLTPRKKSSLFQTVFLSFKQNKLQQMRLLDNLGQETVINFSQVRLNPVLNKSLFQFVTPKDVDVVRQ